MENNDFIGVFGKALTEYGQQLENQPMTPPQPFYMPKMNNMELPSEKLEEIINTSKLDVKIDSERPPYCLFIDGEPVFGLGDISTITGKAKGRKTFAATIITAAMVGNTVIGERIRGELPYDKQGVLFIDTEQSEFYAKSCARRVYGLLDKDYYTEELPNFHAHTLRPYTPAERLQIIEKLIYETPNLGFVVIDGIRDLITSINDEEQATMITSRLLKWSTERMIHICCILHMNKGDNNARGHVGTELMNKSLAVLAVNKLDKNEDYSEIVPVATREKEPKPLVFGIDENGLPFILSEIEALGVTASTDKPKAKEPTDWDDEQHKGILERMFAKESEMKFSDFISAVENAYGIGTSKAKKFVSYFKQKQLVKWEKKGNSTIYSIK